MSVTDYSSMIDVLFSITQTALTAASVAIAPIAQVRWPGSDETTVPPQDQYWARVSEQAVMADQTALSNNVGTSDGKRFDNIGLLWIQVFCPKSDPQAVLNGRLFQQAMITAFRKSSGDANLWFRNQMAKPMSLNPGNYQFNIVVTYQYSEVTRG